MSTDDKTVLVIGATGQQGGAAARALLMRGWDVRALVRDPGTLAARRLADLGARLVRGDLDDPGSLSAAMDGAYGVFLALTMMNGPLVCPAGVAAEQRRGFAVAEQAVRSGVGHLVYSSILGVDSGTDISFYDSKAAIETRLRALEVPATVLRPASLMENFTTLTRPAIVSGELVLAMALHAQTPLPMIAAHDVGEFAAVAFEQPGQLLGATVEIAGDVRTGPEIAAAFGRAAGRSARFARLPAETLGFFDPELARMHAWIDSRPAIPKPAALFDLHPDLMTLETWIGTTNAWRGGHLPFGGWIG
ncbi:NmrA family transcriptional regulator [Catellatospora methionotrophica]|uniref:NmrA family transcriptional regulator n=1 Tax=Catellatospora methionotrophica TaxID=121620 RepID=A0A8J3KZ77_9ACTN|nr:NmrA/HSCARG family protein [Catellatospora methionotrophica]GIG11682.1 NmrA family transcriptional regulator [Catellatospora methionotrophica]